jgi:hypothetical protein
MKTLFFLIHFLALNAYADFSKGILGEIEFESSQFIKQSSNRNSKAVALDMSESGAYGPLNKLWEKSKTGNWYIEYQRIGADAIVMGVVQKDTDAIERGIKIINWGFQQQEKDGSFNHRANFHSTAFFVEAVARSILIIEASDYKQKYKNIIEQLKPKLLLSAKWMTKPEIEKAGIELDSPYTHRYYLNACALGLTGILLAEPTLINQANKYAIKAISMQNSLGFNPEKGGSDTGYQSLGLIFSARYRTIVADDNLRQQLIVMGDKATQWLVSKINANGSIDETSNTRTGESGENGYDGKKKETPLFNIFRGISYWGQILSNDVYVKSAEKVFGFYLTKK